MAYLCSFVKFNQTNECEYINDLIFLSVFVDYDDNQTHIMNMYIYKHPYPTLYVNKNMIIHKILQYKTFKNA